MITYYIGCNNKIYLLVEIVETRRQIQTNNDNILDIIITFKWCKQQETEVYYDVFMKYIFLAYTFMKYTFMKYTFMK